jgi:hypothetical protein
LKSPEQFPSLPPRREFDRLLCLWRLPSFMPHASWSLFRQRENDSYVVRRLMHDRCRGLPVNVHDPHVYGAEGLLQAEEGKRILGAFEALHLPVFNRFPGVGLDGTSYGVRSGNFSAGACIEWWEHGPEGWTPLCDLFEHTVECFERVLPAASLG